MSLNKTHSCQEHRKLMELLGLRLRLENSALNPIEKKEIELRIKELEDELEIA